MLGGFVKVDEEQIVEILKKHESVWISYDSGTSCVYNINYKYVAIDVVKLIKTEHARSKHE